MNFYKYIMGAVLLCSTQIASANCNVGCAPCAPCETSCGPSYYVYADYLYWELCRTDLRYQSGSEQRLLCPGYHSGYRIGGNVQFTCFDIGARYTSFKANHSADVFGDRVSYHADFNVVDIELGRTFALDCANVAIRPFVGAKLAWIDHSFHRDGNDSSDVLFRYRHHYKGYGLLLGFDSKWDFYDWNVCCTCIPLSLVVRGSMAILRAEHDDRLNSESGNHDNCHYTPVFEGFAGLNLSYPTDCYGKFNFLVGYEVQSWQGLHRFNANDEVANIGLGGLVARVGVSF